MNYKKRVRQQRAVERLEEQVLLLQKKVKSQDKSLCKDKLKKAQKTLTNTKHNLDQD